MARQTSFLALVALGRSLWAYHRGHPPAALRHYLSYARRARPGVEQDAFEAQLLLVNHDPAGARALFERVIERASQGSAATQGRQYVLGFARVFRAVIDRSPDAPRLLADARQYAPGPFAQRWLPLPDEVPGGAPGGR